MRIKATVPMETREGFVSDLPGLPVTDTDGNPIGVVVEAHFIAGGGGVIEILMDVAAGSIEVDGIRPDTFTVSGTQLWGDVGTGGVWPRNGETRS